MRPVTPGTGIRLMSRSGAGSWAGAAAGAEALLGAVVQLTKGSEASMRRPTIVKRVFMSFPPVRSDIPESRFKQSRILEFQNKNEAETHARGFPVTLFRPPRRIPYG